MVNGEGIFRSAVPLDIVLVRIDSKPLWAMVWAFDVLQSLVVVFFEPLQRRVHSVHDRRRGRQARKNFLHLIGRVYSWQFEYITRCVRVHLTIFFCRGLATSL